MGFLLYLCLKWALHNSRGLRVLPEYRNKKRSPSLVYHKRTVNVLKFPDESYNFDQIS